VRALWSLPKAAPALLRHIAAYIDLAGLDLARTQRELTAQLVASAVLAVCALFVVLFVCLGIVAYTWDTPYRVAAIAWMGGAFVVVGIVAAIYLGRVSRARSPLLSDVRREWQEDRVILERILSSDEDEA
jgi:uncharacterized membrane protein YqjE